MVPMDIPCARVAFGALSILSTIYTVYVVIFKTFVHSIIDVSLWVIFDPGTVFGVAFGDTIHKQITQLTPDGLCSIKRQLFMVAPSACTRNLCSFRNARKTYTSRGWIQSARSISGLRLIIYQYRRNAGETPHEKTKDFHSSSDYSVSSFDRLDHAHENQLDKYSSPLYFKGTCDYSDMRRQWTISSLDMQARQHGKSPSCRKSEPQFHWKSGSSSDLD